MKRAGVLYYKNTAKILSALTLLILLCFSIVNAEVTYPAPTALKYVNDYTSTLDETTKQYIVSVGKELEDKTGAQEVVVIIDSLQGNDISVYANELFRTWGIGEKTKNNGLLILIALKDRQWRVEVGTGLEGAVTDIYSARVMDNIAAPKFKDGNYSQGIKDSYSLFADSIAAEYNVTLDKNEKVNLPSDNISAADNVPGIVTGVLVMVFIFLDFIFNRGRITWFLLNIAFWFGRGGGRGGGNGRSGGFGGFGGGSSSGGGSSGRW